MSLRVAEAAVARRCWPRGTRRAGASPSASSDGEEREQLHAHTTSVRELPLVALEHAPQLGAGDEREDEVAGRVRDVERHAGAEPRQQRRLGVRVEAVPEPEVHDDAEGEAERDSERGEGEPAAQERPQQPAEQAAAAPGEHLPRRVRALAEEEVRGERGERADGEAARGPSATPAAATITVTGWTPGTGAKRTRPAAASPPSVATSVRSRAETVPPSSQANAGRDDRERRRAGRRAPPRAGSSAAQRRSASASRGARARRP